MRTQFTTIDKLRIRFASHKGRHSETLLLMNPLPESLFCFSPIWDTLAAQFNLLAIDLPGFGKSDARDDLYSVDAMSEFIIKVIDHFEINTAHILGPDIGSPIALFIAARHPMKIKSVMISGGASTYPLNVTNTLRDIIYAPDLEGFKQIPVKDIINSSLSEFKNYVLPEEIRTDYISSYEDGRIFKAMQILRTYIIDIPILDKLIDGIKTPVQIIWGEKDPIVPVENAQILHKRLPKNKLNILPGAGHYTWEEHSKEYASIVKDWLNGGYLFE
jgi:pimeloyl-ACP methyl ester carboxylesterase